MNEEEKQIMNKMIYCNLITGEQALKFNAHINNLQEELRQTKLLKEKYKTQKEVYKSTIDKIKENNQRIIDYGFDYDAFNNVEDLKRLIDMLVDYANKNKELFMLEEIE